MKLSTTLSRLVAKLRTSNKGFTMIELLIVIAILGILAVAVLAAINPVEQINRGRDTGSRSDAEQLISAIDRFYAFKGYNPWVSNPSDDDDITVTIDDNTVWTVTDAGAATDCPVLDRLALGNTTVTSECTGTDELKTSYTERIVQGDYNFLNVFRADSPGASTYVCFEPKSKAFMDEAKERCALTSLPDDFPSDSVCDYNTDGDTTPDDYMICLP